MFTTAAISRDASMATMRGRRSTALDRRLRAGRRAAHASSGLTDETFHGGRAHSDAVAERAVRIATAMHLDAAVVQAVQLASELSEIGSLLIRDGALHPSLPPGVLGLDSVAATLCERLLRARGFPEAAEIVASVDERYDGSGTPRGFAGNAIPIGARILAVARDVETTLEGRPARRDCASSRRARGSRRTRAARSTRTSCRSRSARRSRTQRDGYRCTSELHPDRPLARRRARGARALLGPRPGRRPGRRRRARGAERRGQVDAARDPGGPRRVPRRAPSS